MLVVHLPNPLKNKISDMIKLIGYSKYFGANPAPPEGSFLSKIVNSFLKEDPLISEGYTLDQ